MERHVRTRSCRTVGNDKEFGIYSSGNTRGVLGWIVYPQTFKAIWNLRWWPCRKLGSLQMKLGGHAMLGRGLNPVWLVSLYRRGETETQRDRHESSEDRDSVVRHVKPRDVAGCQQSQSCERINSCSFKPPSLWCFVISSRKLIHLVIEATGDFI